MRRFFLLLLLLLSVSVLSACQSEEGRLHNGYYSATSSSFDHDGWKEFITLCILNNRIITVEFNARNKSGLVLSWDVATLRKLKKRTGTHPNEIIREYAQELLARQSPSRVRRVSGDTVFHTTFTLLAEAALEQSRSGDRAVVPVTLPYAPALEANPDPEEGPDADAEDGPDAEAGLTMEADAQAGPAPEPGPAPEAGAQAGPKP